MFFLNVSTRLQLQLDCLTSEHKTSICIVIQTVTSLHDKPFLRTHFEFLFKILYHQKCKISFTNKNICTMDFGHD
ncbi:CLUMA_CG019739, isoform A [Clunio marinus]|uniref:CLUMA_CG019739, isoform A n=1 Tax=Clunio marinus TaxID=568069 RepID=A0A1J1J2Q9_9DIPT|nr:CLUMA_CG019739, isoform A [Clunio marinus]